MHRVVQLSAYTRISTLDSTTNSHLTARTCVKLRATQSYFANYSEGCTVRHFSCILYLLQCSSLPSHAPTSVSYTQRHHVPTSMLRSTDCDRSLGSMLYTAASVFPPVLALSLCCQWAPHPCSSLPRPCSHRRESHAARQAPITAWCNAQYAFVLITCHVFQHMLIRSGHERTTSVTDLPGSIVTHKQTCLQVLALRSTGMYHQLSRLSRLRPRIRNANPCVRRLSVIHN